jgi:nucleoside-diphosphate-sugar epimerase
LKILVTGASGFVGSAVVRAALTQTTDQVICHVRGSSSLDRLQQVLPQADRSRVTLVKGNLLSRMDAENVISDSDCIVHCAAGMPRSGTAPADLYLNTVVATRNLLEAMKGGPHRRLVLVSSFSVYETASLARGALVNEETPTERHHHKRGDPYALAKVHQEEVAREYADRLGFELVVARPGAIYGPGGGPLSARIGIELPGIFLKLGGRNLLPLSYIDNCADALMVAAMAPAASGMTVNVHDDDLPKCSWYLRRYRREVRRVRTVTLPYPLLLLASAMVEAYHQKTHGQLPPLLSVYRTRSVYVGRRYDNGRLKSLGWRQAIPTEEGIRRTFASLRP